MDITDKVKKTISVDGVPVCDVYTNRSATRAAKDALADGRHYVIKCYCWNNTTWQFDRETEKWVAT